MNGFSRTLPAILGEPSFDRNYFVPDFVIENPESIVAKQDALRYLNVLKQRIKNDHIESMTRIRTNHEEIMKSLQYQALNNYVSGLNSSDRLEIDNIEVLPYVWENSFFGKRKGNGITLKVNR